MRIEFHPQAWVQDYAIEVDPLGPTIWDIETVSPDVLDDTYESDELRFHENAPQWAKDWSGPFYITITREE